jgi:uncharacterized membrane protein YbhN (UPF0104 family)
VSAAEADSEPVADSLAAARSVSAMTAPTGAVLDSEPAPLPGALSASRVRRALIRLVALALIAVAAITLLPGLGELRERFAHANPAWISVAIAFELLSVLAYVPAFRVVFCTRMSWATSYKIALAEEGAGSLLPVGGTGSLALGVWALRRGGMPAAEIARKTVAFFLLTSAPNVAALAIVGAGLAAGILPGHANLALTLSPAAVAVGAIVASLAIGHLARWTEIRLRARPEESRLTRLGPALLATADGVDEAVAQLRHGNPLLLVALVGYMAFDIFVLWASFRAVGSAPEVSIVWIAYLIGQLGNWLPLPGGIGGVEIGLIGTFVLFGLPVATATAAVLLYRVIELWIPAALGIVAFVQLRRLLRREAESIELCQPGDAVEIIGRGPVIAGQAEPRLAARPD